MSVAYTALGACQEAVVNMRDLPEHVHDGFIVWDSNGLGLRAKTRNRHSTGRRWLTLGLRYPLVAVGPSRACPRVPARSRSRSRSARGQWVADWALGTPVHLLGGLLLWRRASLGYVAAPGLLLVSGLGGLAFAMAAVLDDLLAGLRTDPPTIAVHLVISAVSFVLLVFFLGRRTGSVTGVAPSHTG
jgi:hypothetical protein